MEPEGKSALTRKLLNSRQKLKLGTWNVRTLNTPGKLETLEQEMKRYKINIMGLAETKKKGEEGHYYSDEGSMIIHGKNVKRENGVGFIVDGTTSKSVMGYESMSNRVMAVRLASTPINM